MGEGANSSDTFLPSSRLLYSCCMHSDVKFVLSGSVVPRYSIVKVSGSIWSTVGVEGLELSELLPDLTFFFEIIFMYQD